MYSPGSKTFESISAFAVGGGGTSRDEAAHEFDLRARDGSTGLVRDERR